MRSSISRTIIALGLITLAMTACTKYNYINGPDPIAKHNTSMWTYFEENPYDWSLTMELIEHAGLRDIFEGKSEYGSDITFFGIQNHSIRRYLYEQEQINGVEPKITDLPVEECRRWILTCIYPKRRMLNEWTPGRPSTDAEVLIGTGGEMCTMASGEMIWIYTYRESFNNVPEMGRNAIRLVSTDQTRQNRTIVQSHNIDTQTGVVHALSYNFTLNDF